MPETQNPKTKHELFGRVGSPLVAGSVLIIVALSATVVSLVLSRSSGRAATADTTPAPPTAPATTQLKAAPVPATVVPVTTVRTSTVPPTTSDTNGNAKSQYDDRVTAVCQQYVPPLTEIASTGTDGLIFQQTEVKSLVSTMLSDVSEIPAPIGDGPIVTDWIVDWEQAWDAALSENTRLFASEIKAADSTATQIGFGPACM